MYTITKSLVWSILMLVLLSGCAAKRRAFREKHRQLHEQKVVSFYNFMGIKKGDTYEDVKKKLGEPSKVEMNAGTKLNYATVYYNGKYGERLLQFTFDKRDLTVNHLRLTGRSELSYETTHTFFKKRGINDIKADFLGMHRDTVLSVFGKPTRIKTSDYEYEQGGIKVIFSCYTFAYDMCGEIYVFWHMNYKEEE